MFSIQQTQTEVMVWCRTWDGRKVCAMVGKDRFEAQLWIEAANRKPDNSQTVIGACARVR